MEVPPEQLRFRCMVRHLGKVLQPLELLALEPLLMVRITGALR